MLIRDATSEVGREAEKAPPERSERLTVTLAAVGEGLPVELRWRAALKYLLRDCGLRASWPDERGEQFTEVAVWTLHFDGLCEPNNPGGVMAWGWVLDAGGPPREGRGSQPAARGNTNNVAEWYALGCGLAAVVELARERGAPDALRILGDSKLVVCQLSGAWGCNAPHLAVLRDKCRSLLADLYPSASGGHGWQAEWVPRERNGAADGLSRRAYMDRTGTVPPERHKRAG